MLRKFNESVRRIREAIMLAGSAEQDIQEMQTILQALARPKEVEDRAYALMVMLYSHTCLTLANYHDGLRALQNKQQVLSAKKFRTPEISNKIQELADSANAVATNIENYQRLLALRGEIVRSIVANTPIKNRYYR